MCAKLYFTQICCNTNFSTYIYLKENKWTFQEDRKTEEVSYPLGETNQYEDQSKDILNPIILKKNCQWLRGVDRELWADEVLLLK